MQMFDEKFTLLLYGYSIHVYIKLQIYITAVERLQYDKGNTG